MPSKKKDFNVSQQGLSFISQPKEEHEAEAGETVSKIGRPRSRGETKRASIFLDADLATGLKVQAALEGKSISVLISEIVREYLIGKKTLEKFQSEI